MNIPTRRLTVAGVSSRWVFVKGFGTKIWTRGVFLLNATPPTHFSANTTLTQFPSTQPSFPLSTTDQKNKTWRSLRHFSVDIENRSIMVDPHFWNHQAPFFTLSDVVEARPTDTSVLVSFEHSSVDVVATSRRYAWFHDYPTLLAHLERSRNYLCHVAIHEMVLPDSPRSLFFDLDGDWALYSPLHRRWVNEITYIVHWFFGLLNTAGTPDALVLKPTVIRAAASDKYSVHLIFPYIQFLNQDEQDQIVPLLLNTIFCLYPYPKFIAPLSSSKSLEELVSFAVAQHGSNCYSSDGSCRSRSRETESTNLHRAVSLGTQDNTSSQLPVKFNSKFSTSVFQHNILQLSETSSPALTQDRSSTALFPFYFLPPAATRLAEDYDEPPTHRNEDSDGEPQTTTPRNSLPDLLRPHNLIDRAVYRHTLSLRTFYSCKMRSGSYMLHTLLSVESLFNNDKLTGFLGYCNPTYRRNNTPVDLHRLVVRPLIENVIQSFGFTPSFKRVVQSSDNAKLYDIKTLADRTPSQVWQAFSSTSCIARPLRPLNPALRLCNIPFADKGWAIASIRKPLVPASAETQTSPSSESTDANGSPSPLVVDLRGTSLCELFAFCLANLHPERCNDWESWFTVTRTTAACMIHVAKQQLKETLLCSFLDWSQGYPNFDIDENINLLLSIIESGLRRRDSVPLTLTHLFDMVDIDNLGVEFLWPEEIVSTTASIAAEKHPQLENPSPSS